MRNMPSQKTMSIGDVSAISDTPATTLRYYERRGLIDPPDRVGGKRRYGASILQRLMLIKFCRIAGLSLDDIAAVIVDRSPARSVTKQMARRQIDHIDGQFEELGLARRMMIAVIECTCTNVEVCTCGAMQPVIDELRNRLG